MSGLKTEIIDYKKYGDGLCLDQYPDGSVRLICDEEYQRTNEHGIVEYKSRAYINLTKKEMMFLISTYLKNEVKWGSLAEED